MLYILNRHEDIVAIFTNNGSPDSCPYYEDLLKENIETGTSSYEFKIPSNHDKADLVEQGGYVIRKDLDDNLIMFTITEIEETHSTQSDKHIYAENAGLELLYDAIRPVTHMSKNVNQILDIILADTRWVRGETEYFGIDNFYFTEYQSVNTALKYIADKFNAELSFRVKMKNGEVSTRYVDLVEKRGTDTKKRFTFTKDITSIRKKIDMSGVATALIGVGKADNKGVVTTFKSVGKYVSNGDAYTKPLNQDWVGDPDALQKYGIKGKHLLGWFEYETTIPADLLNRTWTELQKRKNPQISYELDVALLERLADLEHEAVRIGDTVYIIDETFSPAEYLEARIIELETCFSDPTRDKCVLANFKRARSNITPEMRALQSKLLQKEATWETVGDIIFKDVVPPTPASINDLWMDISVTPNILKRNTGTEWVNASPTTANEVGAFPVTDGNNLSDTVGQIKEATDPIKIVETVIYAESFTSIMSKQATQEDISDMATGTQLTGVKTDVVKYVDGRLDDEGGINEKINAVSSELTKTASDINAKFKSSGGINIIRNSIGYAGTDLWEIVGTMNTIQNQELEQVGFGSGWYSAVGDEGFIKQKVNISPNETYSLSFWINKSIDDAVNAWATVEIYEDGVRKHAVGKDTGSGETVGTANGVEGWELGTLTFSAAQSEIEIWVSFGANVEAIITGLMLNKGSDPLMWQHANGEVYNTTIQMNLNGLKVIGTNGKNYTIMNQDEFSGYAEVTDDTTGIADMKRIFTLNGATTEVNQLDVEKEITMNPIKIIPIVSADYNGWAFIPSE